MTAERHSSDTQTSRAQSLKTAMRAKKTRRGRLRDSCCTSSRRRNDATGKTQRAICNRGRTVDGRALDRRTAGRRQACVAARRTGRCAKDRRAFGCALYDARLHVLEAASALPDYCNIVRHIATQHSKALPDYCNIVRHIATQHSEADCLTAGGAQRPSKSAATGATVPVSHSARLIPKY